MVDADHLSVAVIVPVLGRPHRVVPMMETVAENTPGPYRLLFVATDTDLPEIEALDAAGADYITVGEPGTFARKINAGARVTTEPLIFTGADDLRFTPGWLEAAARLLSDTIQVVGTCDMGNPRTIRGEHSTHTLVDRRYVDTLGGVLDRPPGQLLCEWYPHDYTDDELVQTAKARRVYAHAFDSVVEHLHPWFKKAPMDATYLLGAKGHAIGRRTFHARQHLWASLATKEA